MTTADEVFGTPAQETLLRRGQALYELLADTPAATYYGRAVGVLHPDAEGLALLQRLVTLQGASNVFGVANDAVADLRVEMAVKGYATTHYATWIGGDDALAAADRILDDTALPVDLTLQVIDGASDPEDLARLAEISLTVGVLPISGAVLRGTLRPGLGIVALDAGGRAVSCAAAAGFANSRSPYGDMAWWGMLATHPDRRGERLALILGAHALREMQRRHGYRRFFTGVQPGNAASEAVCAKCGLAPGETSIVTVIDPAAVEGGKLTK